MEVKAGVIPHLHTAGASRPDRQHRYRDQLLHMNRQGLQDLHRFLPEAMNRDPYRLLREAMNRSQFRLLREVTSQGPHLLLLHAATAQDQSPGHLRLASLLQEPVHQAAGAAEVQGHQARIHHRIMAGQEDNREKRDGQ